MVKLSDSVYDISNINILDRGFWRPAIWMHCNWLQFNQHLHFTIYVSSMDTWLYVWVIVALFAAKTDSTIPVTIK